MKKAINIIILALAISAMAAMALAEPAAVDLDLSAMPASVAYAQALAMQREPEEYLGRTVRIGGIFNYSEARQCGVVIVADTTGYCETSMDFSCADEIRYPEDYPPLYSRFTVVGVVSLCGEAESPLLCLTDAGLEWDDAQTD